MADIYSKAKRSDIMSRIHGRDTKPEDKVATLLTELDVSFRKNVKNLTGTPDFVCSDNNLIIFVHGCFWHGHKNCKRAYLPATNKNFWREKIAKNTRRDMRVEKKLRNDGWHVINIWQCRLNNMERVKKRIMRMVD